MSDTFVSGVWRDSSGNNRATVPGTGEIKLVDSSSDGLPALMVDVGTSFEFPEGSIPEEFTILVVARALKPDEAGMIFGAKQHQNWFLGKF